MVVKQVISFCLKSGFLSREKEKEKKGKTNEYLVGSMEQLARARYERRKDAFNSTLMFEETEK